MWQQELAVLAYNLVQIERPQMLLRLNLFFNPSGHSAGRNSRFRQRAGIFRRHQHHLSVADLNLPSSSRTISGYYSDPQRKRLQERVGQAFEAGGQNKRIGVL